MGVLCALSVPQLAGAEGFAINEWSAEGVAMGGARMFAEGDAANVAYNPASITKVDGEAFKASVTYLSPHGDYDLYDGDTVVESGHNRVHFGFAPGSYYVKKINDKDWFGIGAFSRFAMVSEFERNSAVSTNAFVSRLDGVSITPTFAHKFDNKWSAAVGAEVNYVRLTMEKNIAYNPFAGVGVGPTHTKGESYALGWNAAVNYAFDDKNEIGVVYRSRIKHSMEADFKGYTESLLGRDFYGDAYGEVTLLCDTAPEGGPLYGKPNNLDLLLSPDNINDFFVWDLSTGTSELSLIWGVQNGQVYESNISGQYCSVHWAEGPGLAGYQFDYSKGYRDYIVYRLNYDSNTASFTAVPDSTAYPDGESPI